MTSPPAVDLRAFVRDIPDFPTPGIVFKDITPLMADAGALDAAVRALADHARPKEVDVIIAAEARGLPARPGGRARARRRLRPGPQAGKLPWSTVRAEYLLEYGSDALELHSDAVTEGSRVLVHDDLLATGGTARALTSLVEQLGGEVVGCSFLIELAFLGGREKLAPHDVHALLEYDGE
jgi:adenine phosphoribosyltransferase